MSNRISLSLNEGWDVNANHALYRKNGTWYHRLTKFPGALFDETGYVLFATEAEYANCQGLRIKKQTSCPKGIARLSNYVQVVESGYEACYEACDIAEPCTKRSEIKVNRIVRDSPLSRRVKRLHSDRCQICGLVLTLGDGASYSEAHHIKPLGGGHKGPDVKENIICVCPNCHAQLDHGGIRLDKSALRTVSGHGIKDEYIEYHNRVIHQSTRRGKDSYPQ